MSRPRGSKNKISDEVIVEETNVVEQQETVEARPEATEHKLDPDLDPDPEPVLEPDETVSVYEASQHFRTTEQTIKTWIDHGHLTERNGRIPVRSIKECRFNTRRMI